MYKLLIFIAVLLASIFSFGQKITVPGLKWDELYTFDKYNEFEILAYSSKNELMRTLKYKTYYQSHGENFAVMLDNPRNTMLAIIDKKNEVCVNKYSGGNTTPLYNTTKYKFPPEKELKKLELTSTSETKKINGYNCTKYTFTYKKIFGEVWITNELNLSNDLGIFRASKMMAIHNTYSVGGFVMEIINLDAKGGKTVMTTKKLVQNSSFTIDLKGVEMNTSINKVSYYTFN